MGGSNKKRKLDTDGPKARLKKCRSSWPYTPVKVQEQEQKGDDSDDDDDDDDDDGNGDGGYYVLHCASRHRSEEHSDTVL